MATMHEFVEGNRSEHELLATPTGTPGTLDMKLIKLMWETLNQDRSNAFDMAYDYLHGEHTKPYAPATASEQIKDLQARSITNWMPLLINLPTQVSYVEGYRRGNNEGLARAAREAGAVDVKRYSPEYRAWQRNRMDGRQATIYRAALTYGQSFALVNTIAVPGKPKIEVLPTRHTIAFFDDPVNDIRPKIVLSIKSYARDEKNPGLAVVWDDTHRYELTFDFGKEFTPKGDKVPHGFESGCPVVRYTCGALDDEGHSEGVITRTMISLQDRVNQAAFSSNITADFGAFKVRTAAGLQVNYKLNSETGEPLLDAAGNPIPEPIAISQAKMLVSDDPDTKFGQLDETPLGGYLAHEDQSTKNLAAIAQFPLHALIGNVSNLSAEALEALEKQFMRHMTALHVSWGESHEELFRLIAEALGDEEGMDSYGGEVRWRDMSSKAYGAVMDGLGKAADMLGVPKRGLWSQIPGLTSGDLEDFDELHEEELSDVLFNNTTPQASANREVRTQRPQPSGVGGNPADVT